MSSMSVASSRAGRRLNRCQKLRFVSVQGPSIDLFTLYVQHYLFHDAIHNKTDSTFARFGKTCGESRSTVPRRESLALQLLAVSKRPLLHCQCVIFSSFFEIATQLLSNVLMLRLVYCTWRYCNLFVKNDFPWRLRQAPLRLFDCYVQGQLIHCST